MEFPQKRIGGRRCQSIFPHSGIRYADERVRYCRRKIREDGLFQLLQYNFRNLLLYDLRKQQNYRKEAERQKKEQEILATWFLRKEYINAGWFKRFFLRLEFAFRSTRGESHIPQIPEHIRKEIARCLLPDIVAYFESEQGQREFAEWKAQQEAVKKEKSEGV